MSDRGVPGTGRKRLLSGLLAAGSLVMLAGCAGGAPAGGAGHTANPAFRVDNPRNVAAIADRPCLLLSPEQASRFGIDRPGRQIRGMLGSNDCEWRSSRLDVWIYLSAYTDRTTLEETYARRDSLPYFELTRIGGYPASMSKTEVRLPVCDIDIKPAEHQSVTVTYDSTKLNAQPGQGCPTDRQVAEVVVTNLPPAA